MNQEKNKNIQEYERVVRDKLSKIENDISIRFEVLKVTTDQKIIIKLEQKIDELKSIKRGYVEELENISYGKIDEDKLFESTEVKSLAELESDEWKRSLGYG